MRNHRHLLLKCLVVTILLNPAQWCSAATLFGGVTHSETVAPVNESYPQLSPPHAVPIESAVVSQNRPTLQRPAVEWFPIPKQMAGQWTKKGDLSEGVTDLTTGITTPANQWTNNVMTVTWGHQADRQGNIWHANFIPSERDGSSDGKVVKFLTVSMKCESATEQGLVTRTHYIVSESYGERVADVFQQESLNDYTFLNDGQMQNTSSNRVFTYQGQPTRAGNLLSRFTKTAGFAPEATQYGIDLAASLADF